MATSNGTLTGEYLLHSTNHKLLLCLVCHGRRVLLWEQSFRYMMQVVVYVLLTCCRILFFSVQYPQPRKQRYQVKADAGPNKKQNSETFLFKQQSIPSQPLHEQ